MKKILILFLLMTIVFNGGVVAQMSKYFNPYSLGLFTKSDYNKANRHMKSFRNNHDKDLHCLKGFSFSREKFSLMQATLGISTPCDAGNIFCYAIRIYPAFDGNEMYLVFMGEQFEKDKKLTTMTEKSYYVLKSNDNSDLKEVNDAASKTVTDGEIKVFQTKFGMKKFAMRSLFFTIEEYDSMVGTLDAANGHGPDTNDTKYYVRLRPAYNFFAASPIHVGSPNKLYLVVNEEQRTSNLGGGFSSIVLHDKFENGWYNHMDPCPDKCPTNEK